MSPPSRLPPHPTLQPVAEPLFEFPESYPLAVDFTQGVVNFCVTLHISSLLPSSPPAMSIGLFSVSVSSLLP